MNFNFERNERDAQEKEFLLSMLPMQTQKPNYKSRSNSKSRSTSNNGRKNDNKEEFPIFNEYVHKSKFSILIPNYFSVNERNKLIRDAAFREQADKEYSQKEYETLLNQKEYQK